MDYNLVDAKVHVAEYHMAMANDHNDVTNNHDDAMHGIHCAHYQKKLSF